jgi:superfamily II DNA or RNA helicase
MIDLNAVLAKYEAVEQRDYQKACIKDIVDSLNDSTDILINLPTGAGKTMVYSPIVAEIFEHNLRTLVLTSTKQAQRRVKSEIEKFLNRKGESTLIYGIQEYVCPILGRKAENWFCAENKEECRKTRIACEVIKSDKEYAEKSLIVTNFAKFLLSQFGGNYDVIVLDDSHSFENSKEQAYQLTIQAANGRRLFEEGTKGKKLLAFISDFLNIYAEVFERCIVPTEKEGVVSPEYISSFAALEKKHDLEKLRKK